LRNREEQRNALVVDRSRESETLSELKQRLAQAVQAQASSEGYKQTCAKLEAEVGLYKSRLEAVTAQAKTEQEQDQRLMIEMKEKFQMLMKIHEESTQSQPTGPLPAAREEELNETIHALSQQLAASREEAVSLQRAISDQATLGATREDQLVQELEKAKREMKIVQNHQQQQQQPQHRGANNIRSPGTPLKTLMNAGGEVGQVSDSGSQQTSSLSQQEMLVEISRLTLVAKAIIGALASVGAIDQVFARGIVSDNTQDNSLFALFISSFLLSYILCPPQPPQLLPFPS
jgi:hypothetical protein